MLPGIRFVCAAVVLAVSLVIFGMGAAALLRSAHEEFASLPNRRPPPATVFSRQPEPTPTLAMLRMEPHATELPEPVAAPAPQASEPAPSAEPVVTEVNPAPEAAIAVTAVAPVAEPEKPAVIEVVAVPASEPATVIDATPVETAETAPAAPQAAPAPETTGSISLPTAVTMDLPTATLTAEDAQLSSTKVAVLGGPPISTEPVPLPNMRPVAELPKAKPAKKVEKKKKKPAAKRARVAARTTTAAPAPFAQQQQNDPFGLSQLR